MNSGAEAVESGIKVARKWATDVKGVPAGESNIVVAQNNFHGRTTTIISFSDDETARRGFGPYTPGFRSVPFGDHRALAEAVDANTAAVLIEPIQGEAGIIVPPADYLPRVRDICSRNRVLMIADEISPAWPHRAHLRLRTLGCGSRRLPARQGSGRRRGTAVRGGGRPRHPRRAAPRRARFHLRRQPTGRGHRHHGCRHAAPWRIPARSTQLGEHLHKRLTGLIGHGVTAVRGMGLWAGVDIDPDLGTGKQFGLALAERGVLVKDTHGSTLRFAPPLVVTADELDWAVDQFADTLTEARR